MLFKKVENPQEFEEWHAACVCPNCGLDCSDVDSNSLDGCPRCGYGGEQFEEEDKCQKCGSTDLKWYRGYPGEQFLCCEKCGEIVESDINPYAEQ